MNKAYTHFPSNIMEAQRTVKLVVGSPERMKVFVGGLVIGGVIGALVAVAVYATVVVTLFY